MKYLVQVRQVYHLLVAVLMKVDLEHHGAVCINYDAKSDSTLRDPSDRLRRPRSASTLSI